MPDLAQPELESHLSKFGLSAFRPGQREVISAIFAGEDCLCVMPTGGGKSLCYQLPAVARDGVTLVVSPLIALMQDQVSQLQAVGVRATLINSTLDAAEQYARLDSMAAGQYDLVYVAAERFRSGRFLDAVRATRLQLLAIDEAHCISEWGHDFRPDYARLGRYRAKLGNPPTIALTATATDAVRRDIVEQLNLRDPRTFITGFARPNLFYEVQAPSGQRQKDDMLVQFLKDNPGSGIVYASTRKRCEEVAQTIASETRRGVGIYHAGLMHDDRRKAQEAFMKGRMDVVVATNAFGMGIDKSDVRFVLHYNLPGTLEAYYQEAGRAGRDGNPSRCLLLFSTGDRYIQEFFIESAYPSRDVVSHVYDYLRSLEVDPIEKTLQEIKEELGLKISSEGVGACEQLLEKAGALERLESRQNMAMLRLESELPTLVDLLPRQAAKQRKVLQAVERIVGPRRQEWVYFHPRDLADRTEMDPAALGRSLRELRQLSAFDYVPPFRGRAIHMLQRDRTLDELEIDFSALEQRKADEYLKLDRVVNFARTKNCRQQEILNYFGQQGEEACGHCDNCGSHPQATATGRAISPNDEPVLEVVRKILSGVARTHSKFGKHVVAQMLCGSGSVKMARFRLDRLSTYGLLKHLRQEEVAAVIDALLAAQYLEQREVEQRRPVLELTESGTLIMRGHAVLTGLVLPEELCAKIYQQSGISPEPIGSDSIAPNGGSAQSGDESESPPPEFAASPMNPPDAALLEKLKIWRKETAAVASIPAYQVLPNTALEELSRRRPSSQDELLNIKGIGPAKAGRFGEAILALLQIGTAAAPSKPSTPALRSIDGFEDAQNELLNQDAAIEEMPASSYAASEVTRHAPASLGTATVSAETAAMTVRSDPNFTESKAPESELPVGALSPVVVPQCILPTDQAQPNHYWTWRLLRAQFTPQECATIRGLSGNTVLDHALRAAEAGWPVEVEWFLTPSTIAMLEEKIGAVEPKRIRPLLARLPGGLRYEEVQLFLKCRSIAKSVPPA